MWQSLSIAKKIWFSLGILVAGYFASMLFGFHLGSQTENRLTDVSAALFPAAMNSRHSLTTFNEQRKLYYDAVMLGEKTFISKAFDKFEQTKLDLQAVIELKGLKPEKIEITKKIMSQLTEYTTSAKTVYGNMILDFDNAGDISDEQMALVKKEATFLDKQGDRLHSRMITFAGSFAEDLKKEIASINRTTRQQRNMNIILFFAVVVTALSLIAIIISRSIVRPLEKTFMLEKAVKQSIDGIAVADPLDGKLTFFNTTWSQMFGYNTEELRDVHMSLFHTEEQMQDDVLHLNDRLEREGAFTGETGFKRKNGSTFPASVTASVLKDETGEVQSFLFSVKDITEEKKAEEELIRITQAVESSSDAIGISDIQGNHFYQNPAFTRLYGYELEEFKAGKHPGELCPDEVAAREVFKTIQNGDRWSGELEMINKNGLKIIVRLNASPVKDNEGNTIAFISSHTDITERKKAESELAAAQQELVEKAHQAGMADIATGTLHNVGNILNSVKTSAQIIGDIQGSSSISGFQKANNMLRENIDSIDEFLIKDPKGKKLMQYYLKLEDGFNVEHKRTMEHITRLMEKVNAIVDVIAAQQSYAGASGLTEDYDLSEVVEDALTMQSGSTTRHGVNILKDFQDTPQVPIQKTKLVHILINLIKNAKEAMVEIEKQRRKLTVSIDSSSDAIFIKVSDTGAGIALDNLEKIFSHGFTTKQNGHGFGLHSSANYIKEMGGRMWAESEGEGRGATFILRFPYPHESQRDSAVSF